MKQMNILFILAACMTTTGCGSNDTTEPVVEVSLDCSPSTIESEAAGSTSIVKVTANREWKVYSDNEWITYTPKSSINNYEEVNITVKENKGKTEREGKLIFLSGGYRDTVHIFQKAPDVTPPDPSITVPEGYELVWNDEFNDGNRPDTDIWYYETGGGGWGNNELQNYVSCSINGEQLANIEDGIFKITAKKIGSTVYSIRINTKESWTYGYFEARLKLPGGKGTWPAFWMMPKNYTAWPDDGEIDIMEQVGYRTEYVSSAIHCKSYNHSINTEKTGEKRLPSAESEFHVYALKWTKDYIKTYVDGECIFTFNNDGKGNKNTWPFYTPFYLKLNLAWGGNWGGSQGVDESAQIGRAHV